MTGSMDRLERLFFKKRYNGTYVSVRQSVRATVKASVRASVAGNKLASIPASPSSSAKDSVPVPVPVYDPALILASPDQHFPQPSFIRPTSSRMVPREDGSPVPRPATATPGRSHSLPDDSPRTVAIKTTRRVSTSHMSDSRRNTAETFGWDASEESLPDMNSTTSSSCSTASTVSTPPNASYPRVPLRTSSLRDRRDESMDSLAPFELPQLRYSTTTDSSGEVSPAILSTAMSKPQLPPLKLHLDDLHDVQPMFLCSRADTPPPSDPETSKADMTDLADLMGASLMLPLFPMPPSSHAQPTPDSSPKMSAADTTPTERKLSALLPENPLLRDDAYDLLDEEQIIKNCCSTKNNSNKAMPPSPAARRKMRSSLRRSTIRLPAVPTLGDAVSSCNDPVLKEPNLGDFLSLSDDDIAETGPAAASASASASTLASAATAESISTEDESDSLDKTTEKTPTKELKIVATPPLSISSPSVSSTSPPVSPVSMVRRLALCHESAPSRPPSFQAPPPPSSVSSYSSMMPASIPVGRPQTLAGQARMAAAFEIARIASQYSFDLAYIATIWPKNMAFLHSSHVVKPFPKYHRSSSHGSHSSSRVRVNRFSHMSHVSHASHTTHAAAHPKRRSICSGNQQGSPAPMSQNQSGLEAQFLAAYGLATVQAPYSLSAPAHAKILNADRWLEFHEPDASAEEFSTGFGCAFYRGHTPVMAPMPMPSHLRPRKPASVDDCCCDADTEQDSFDAEEEEDVTTEDASGRTTPRPPRRSSRNSASVFRTAGNGRNNRGIVFVAYRRKDAQAIPLQNDDLEALYRDVEALVDKILDTHMHQKRQSQLEMLRTIPGMMMDDVLAPKAVF